jgi:tetratricopeptide (TPR) repeat protein
MRGARPLVLWVALVSVFAAGFVAAQQTAKALLDDAQAKKTAGDLQGAAEGFERVVAEFAASDRGSAARALLALGEIFDSLGQAPRSRAYYERVRDQFKDQAAEAGIAANRLNGPSTRSGPSKVTIRTPFADDVYGFAISPDGHTLVFQGTSPEGKRQLWRQAVRRIAEAGADYRHRGSGCRRVSLLFPGWAHDRIFCRPEVASGRSGRRNAKNIGGCAHTLGR